MKNRYGTRATKKEIENVMSMYGNQNHRTNNTVPFKNENIGSMAALNSSNKGEKGVGINSKNTGEKTIKTPKKR